MHISKGEDMEDRNEKLIRKISGCFSEFFDVTPIYRISLVLEDGTEESFADFYGKTFSITECKWLDELEDRAKANDKDIEEMRKNLYAKIEEHYGQEVAVRLKTEIDFAQFHGDDHKGISIHDNAIYCTNENQAFENFKHYALDGNSELAETEGDRKFDEFLQSDLFKHLKDL